MVAPCAGHGLARRFVRKHGGRLEMDDVTRILSAIEGGDPHASEALLPLVYDELRQLAARKLSRERPGHTLHATDLVHEAYVRLVGSAPAATHWDNRRHFFAAAAEAMRRILINRARDRKRLKRGGGRARLDLDQVELALDTPDDELLALNEALEDFARNDSVGAELVKLRFFGGLTQAEAARALAVSRRTADRHWAFARAWLYDRLRGQGD